MDHMETETNFGNYDFGVPRCFLGFMKQFYDFRV